VKAPDIYLIWKHGEFGGTPVAWSFDRNEAEAECLRLNNGDEFGSHVVTAVPAVTDCQ
jgi:hypothetical protein